MAKQSSPIISCGVLQGRNAHSTSHGFQPVFIHRFTVLHVVHLSFNNVSPGCHWLTSLPCSASPASTCEELGTQGYLTFCPLPLNFHSSAATQYQYAIILYTYKNNTTIWNEQCRTGSQPVEIYPSPHLDLDHRLTGSNSEIHFLSQTIILQNTIHFLRQTIILQNTIHLFSQTIILQHTIHVLSQTITLQNTIHFLSQTIMILWHMTKKGTWGKK